MVEGLAAKGPMAYDKTFWTKLAQEAGVAAEQLQAIEQVFAHDGFLKAANDRVLAKDDYSRSHDQLKKEKEGYQQWYNQALKTFEENQKAVSDAQTAIKAYQDTYGDLPAGTAPANGTGTNPVATPVGDWISKKDLEEKLGQLSNQAVGLMTTMTTIGIDYFTRFNEKLDLDALTKFAAEKGLPLAAAYESFVAPKLAEKSAKEWEAKVQQAREEGARDALAKHQLPVDSRPAEPSLLFHQPKPDEVPADKRAAEVAFRDLWNTDQMREAALKP